MKRFLVTLLLIFGISIVGFGQKVIVRDSTPQEWGIMAKSPVTGVEFKVRKDTKVAEYRGKTYYFDSRKDLDMFLADPRKYAGPFVNRRKIESYEFGRVVVSPVTGKVFFISPSVISVEVEGRVYYFVSENELNVFLEDPDRYPVLSVDMVVTTNVIVRTNYIIITNVQLVNEYDIKTNYIIRTNAALSAFKPQVLGQEEKVVVIKEEPKEDVVVVNKTEPVIKVIINLDEEKRLIKFEKKHGKDTYVVREPHPKEIGKLATSPVSKVEFVITQDSYVVRKGKDLYFLKDKRELDIFLNSIEKYSR